MSGQNALLSLLSQDDFTKLKQEIHNHIDKGKIIEEIAASDEEDLSLKDDDDVILTSVRGGDQQKKQNRKESSSRSRIEDYYNEGSSSRIEDSPR
jgi:hypothetical protein